MQTIDFVTLFPEMMLNAVNHSILARAAAGGFIEFGAVDPRAFADDSRGTVDDSPFGGGPGMIMKIETLSAAIASKRRQDSVVVLLDPSGARFDQPMANRLSTQSHLMLICGHYGGVDYRVFEQCNHVVSIGDFVLTGGEIPALAIADAVVRLIPRVLGDTESLDADALSNGLLGYPQYTRPASFNTSLVPNILQSGDHKAIQNWRRERALKLTRANRPDLFCRAPLQKNDLDLL